MQHVAGPCSCCCSGSCCSLHASPCSVSFMFVLQAANYLNIKGLLDLTCQTVANMIKGAHGLGTLLVCLL